MKRAQPSADADRLVIPPMVSLSNLPITRGFAGTLIASSFAALRLKSRLWCQFLNALCTERRCNDDVRVQKSRRFPSILPRYLSRLNIPFAAEFINITLQRPDRRFHHKLIFILVNISACAGGCDTVASARDTATTGRARNKSVEIPVFGRFGERNK